MHLTYEIIINALEPSGDREFQEGHWRVIKGNTKHQGQVPEKMPLPLPAPSPSCPGSGSGRKPQGMGRWLGHLCALTAPAPVLRGRAANPSASVLSQRFPDSGSPLVADPTDCTGSRAHEAPLPSPYPE